MTPVILLSDAYLAHAAEPWRLPDAAALPRFPVRFRTDPAGFHPLDRKSTRLNSSHLVISYAVFCLKKKKRQPPARPSESEARRHPHRSRALTVLTRRAW